MSDRRPTALGAYIFAGGFTLGVRRYFDVMAHLEESDYGVETARRNLPGLPIHYGPGKWPIEALKDGPEIDFLYGNPPCAAWSVAGYTKTRGTDKWRTDPRVECTVRHFGLLKALRPKVWAWESVTQAYTRGWEFVSTLAREAADLGYSSSFVLHDVQWMGLPQVRKRFFMVCHRIDVPWQAPNWAPPPTPPEVLREARSGDEQLHRDGPMFLRNFPPEVLAHVKPGERLAKYWERAIGGADESKWTRKENGDVLGRPSFGHYRLPVDRPGGAVVGYNLVHPVEHRFLSVAEMQVLSGFPRDFIFTPTSAAKRAAECARGVCPPAGEWLANQIRRAVEEDHRFPRDVPIQQEVDFRQPPSGSESLVRLVVLAPPGGDGRARTSEPKEEEPMKNENLDADFGTVIRRVAASAADPWDADFGPVRRAPTMAPIADPFAEYGPAPCVVHLTPSVPNKPSAPVPVGEAPSDAPGPELGEGSGAYVRKLILLQRGWTVEDLVALVHRHFAGRNTRASDIKWNWARVKKEHPDLPPLLSAGRRAVPMNAAAPIMTATVSPEATLTTVAALTELVKAASVMANADRGPEEEEAAEGDDVFDRSSLRGGSYGYRVHRDYAAHFFRWGWVGRMITNETTVIDVGCGADAPFVRTTVGMEATGRVPKSYVGVDLNGLQNLPKRGWATFHERFNFLERHAELGAADVLICLEVIEHMSRENGDRLLAGLRACLAPGGRIVLSTPVRRGEQAKNHIHEYTIPELTAAIATAGLTVEKRFGTFARYRDLKEGATEEHIAALIAISEYYQPDVCACFLAPLYPDYSSNNLWVLRAGDTPPEPKKGRKKK